jgi:hypothetical protein
MGEGVTRQKRRKGTVEFDGAFSGALQVIPIQFSNGATGITYSHAIDLPAGMKLRIVAIDVQALGISNDPALTVGSAKAGTQIVATVDLTTNLGSLTLKDVTDSIYTTAAGGIVEVQIINDADAAFASCSVNIYAYVSAPPTSLTARNINHY